MSGPIADIQQKTLGKRTRNQQEYDSLKRARIAAILRNSRKRMRDGKIKQEAHKRSRMDINSDNAPIPELLPVDDSNAEYSDPMPELLSVEESEAIIQAGFGMTLDPSDVYDVPLPRTTAPTTALLPNCNRCRNITDESIRFLVGYSRWSVPCGITDASILHMI